MRRWTVPRLHDACWRALRSGKVRVRFRPIAGASALIETNGDPERAVVTADGFQGGDLENIAHELLHYVLENEWPRDLMGRYVEEAIVTALEDRIVRHVNRDPRLVRKWRRQIARLRNAGSRTARRGRATGRTASRRPSGA